MKAVLSACALALAMAAVLPCAAQNKTAPKTGIADQKALQSSPVYKQAFREGKRDRGDNLAFRPQDSFVQEAERRAYDAGYKAGYCSEEDKTGYYDGTYHDYGGPYIKNGYYGYNAPKPECASQAKRKKKH